MKGDVDMNYNYENLNDMGEDGESNEAAMLAAAMAVIAAVPALIKTVNEILGSEISFPNIPLKVMAMEDGVWDTLAESKGWRLQQNEITKHCRIIDPENVRRAWGTKNGMYKALDALNDCAKYHKM